MGPATFSFTLLAITVVLLALKEWQIQGYPLEIYVAVEYWWQGVFVTRRMSYQAALSHTVRGNRPQVGEPAYTPGFIRGEVQFCGLRRLMFQESISRVLRKK